MEDPAATHPNPLTVVRAGAREVTRLLGLLAAQDIHLGAREPAESYTTALAVLRSMSRGDARVLLNVHRAFFPFMGPIRAAAAARAGIRGAPPAHPYFLEVLRDSIVSDNAGWSQARKRYGARTCNAVGIGACLVAAVCPTQSDAVALARAVVSITHRDRDSISLGVYVGLLGWLAARNLHVRGMTVSTILDAAMPGLSREFGLERVHDAVEMGKADDSAPAGAGDDLMPALGAARLAGVVWHGGDLLHPLSLGRAFGRVVRPFCVPILSLVSGETDPDPHAIKEVSDALGQDALLGMTTG